MRYTIIPKDSNKAINIRDDADFKELLREQIGDHASDYYEMRIKDFYEVFEQLKNYLEAKRHSKIRDETLEYVKDISSVLFHE